MRGRARVFGDGRSARTLKLVRLLSTTLPKLLFLRKNAKYTYIFTLHRVKLIGRSWFVVRGARWYGFSRQLKAQRVGETTRRFRGPVTHFIRARTRHLFTASQHVSCTRIFFYVKRKIPSSDKSCSAKRLFVDYLQTRSPSSSTTTSSSSCSILRFPTSRSIDRLHSSRDTRHRCPLSNHRKTRDRAKHASRTEKPKTRIPVVERYAARVAYAKRVNAAIYYSSGKSNYTILYTRRAKVTTRRRERAKTQAGVPEDRPTTRSIVLR